MYPQFYVVFYVAGIPQNKYLRLKIKIKIKNA